MARRNDIAIAEAAAVGRTMLTAIVTGKDPPVGDRVSAMNISAHEALDTIISTSRTSVD